MQRIDQQEVMISTNYVAKHRAVIVPDCARGSRTNRIRKPGWPQAQLLPRQPIVNLREIDIQHERDVAGGVTAVPR